MTHLASFLPVENIVLEIDYSSVDRVFEAVGYLFEQNHGIAHEKVVQNLLAREQIGSTALAGVGAAIPHGRIKGLKAPIAAMMRLKNPIPFGASNGEFISLFMFLLVPQHATQQHLEILSEIAELFSDPQRRQKLTTETDPAIVHHLLTERSRLIGIQKS